MEKWEEYKINPENFYQVMSQKMVGTATMDDKAPQELLGVTDEVLHHYYKAAIKLLDEHNWHDAKDAFTFLTFLNPLVHNFWVGLGIAEQSQSKFDEAILAYTMAEATDPNDPVPCANAYQCGLAIHENDFAKYSLEKAISLCGEHEEFAALKAQLVPLHK